MGCYKFDSHALTSIPAPEKFEAVHIRSVIALIAFAILSLMGLEVSIVSVALACILVYTDKLDEKEVIGMVPWPTMIMIAGMGMFIGTMQAAGGVDLIATSLKSMLNEKTAGPLFAIIGNVLSMVSDGGGVVTPAMVPIAASLGIAGGLNAVKLVVALTLGEGSTSFSPLSTGGATVLSCQTGYDDKLSKLYSRQLITSILWSVGQLVLIIFNVYILA